MKLLMLCREPRLYSCQRLKEAAKHQGHEMDILDPNLSLKTLTKSTALSDFLSRKFRIGTLFIASL